MKKLKQIAKKGLIVLGNLVFITILIGAMAPTSVNAAETNNQCKEAAVDNLTVTSLFTPGKFIPVVPDECSGEPLKLDVLPNIIARAYALIAGLVIYLFIIMMVVYGTLWMLAGFTEDTDANVANVKRNIKVSIKALLITLTISLIVIELLKLIGVDTSALNI